VAVPTQPVLRFAPLEAKATRTSVDGLAAPPSSNPSQRRCLRAFARRAGMGAFRLTAA